MTRSAGSPASGENPYPNNSIDAIRFAEQARATGLVLPVPRRANVGLTMVVIVVVLLSAVGVGALTGWMNLRVTVVHPLPLYGAQNCGGESLNLTGATAPEVGPAFSTWLLGEGASISNQTGGCVHLQVRSSSGDGYVPDLGGRSVSFAATSGSPTTSDLTSLASSVVVYPVALDPVAVVYNLPGLATSLQLNGTVLAGIYSGTITNWDATALAHLNPGLVLPHLTITVVYQGDSSLTNSAFTSFLSQSSSNWSSSVGSGSSVSWPYGVATDGPTALTVAVAATAGAVGYTELFNGSGALLPYAQLENSGGAFASPTITATEAAATEEGSSPAVTERNWANFSLVNAPGNASYPIDQLAYLAVYEDLGTAYGGAMTLSNATWLMTFLWWISESTAFAPLPLPFVSAAQSTLVNVTYDGTPILQVQETEGGESGSETGEF